MYYNEELMPTFEHRMIYMFNVKKIDNFDIHVSYIIDRLAKLIQEEDIEYVCMKVSENLNIFIFDKSSPEIIASQIVYSDYFAPILTNLRIKRQELFLNQTEPMLKGTKWLENNENALEDIDYKKEYEDSLREKELDELNFDTLIECLSSLIEN